MFGKNPIRSKETNEQSLSIVSTFYTIQGEGPYSGVPALFIRLAGCNLACTFCDTEFEKGAVRLMWQDLINRMAQFPVYQRRLVVITGGEPLRQQITPLCEWLLASGTQIIQIETSGTMWQAGGGLERMIDAGRLVLVISPKTPGIHPQAARLCHHWKYIIKAGEISPTDGLPNRGTQPGNLHLTQRIYRPWPEGREYDRGSRDVIWVSPCDEYDEDRNQLNLLAVGRIAMEHGYRISLQTHKILGLE